MNIWRLHYGNTAHQKTEQPAKRKKAITSVVYWAGRRERDELGLTSRNQSLSCGKWRKCNQLPASSSRHPPPLHPSVVLGQECKPPLSGKSGNGATVLESRWVREGGHESRVSHEYGRWNGGTDAADAFRTDGGRVTDCTMHRKTLTARQISHETRIARYNQVAEYVRLMPFSFNVFNRAR